MTQRIYCDKCKKEIVNAEYAELNYLKTALSPKGELGKQSVKSHFCVSCKDKIIKFIETK